MSVPRRPVRPLRVLGLVAAAVLVLAACSSDRRFPTADDLAEVDVTPTHTITVDAEGFDPAELTIASGEVVLLVNGGEGDHSFSAEERFDTGLLRPGETTTLRLEQPGEIPYVDRATGAEGTLVIEPMP